MERLTRRRAAGRMGPTERSGRSGEQPQHERLDVADRLRAHRVLLLDAWKVELALEYGCELDQSERVVSEVVHEPFGRSAADRRQRSKLDDQVAHAPSDGLRLQGLPNVPEVPRPGAASRTAARDARPEAACGCS